VTIWPPSLTIRPTKRLKRLIFTTLTKHIHVTIILRISLVSKELLKNTQPWYQRNFSFPLSILLMPFLLTHDRNEIANHQTRNEKHNFYCVRYWKEEWRRWKIHLAWFFSPNRICKSHLRPCHSYKRESMRSCFRVTLLHLFLNSSWKWWLSFVHLCCLFQSSEY
jgi:hypothetical protein